MSHTRPQGTAIPAARPLAWSNPWPPAMAERLALVLADLDGGVCHSPTDDTCHVTNNDYVNSLPPPQPDSGRGRGHDAAQGPESPRLGEVAL